MHRFKAALALGLLMAGVEPVGAAASEPGVTVSSLDQAVRLALERSPALQASQARIGIGQGELQQAGLLPNPELSVEVENAAGSGSYRGLRSAEITYGLNQKIELGGKRSARVQVAGTGLDLAVQEAEVARLDLVRDVSRAYAEFVAAARGTALEEERARLAGELLRIARGRVEAGKEPLVQRRKAEVALSTARIAVARARRDYDAARRGLLTLLGGTAVDVVPDHGWFETVARHEPPGAGDHAGTDGNPDLRRWGAELARSRAELASEQAKAYPDVIVGAGVRQLRESGDTALVVGLSVPLPLFDRNQGARLRAMSDFARVEAEARQGRLALAASLADARASLETARDEVHLLRAETLPAAEQAHGFARDGYQAGKFPFLDVLDAQRALFDAREQLNAALREFHLREAVVRRLTGHPAIIGGVQ